MKPITNKVANYINTGAALCDKGQFIKAIESFNHAITLDSSNAIAHLNRAYANLMTGNLPGMDADLNRARDLDPQNPEIHFKIGKMCRKIHVYMVAIKALSCAIELKTDYEEAWVLLADCYYRIGAVDQARNVYIEAQKKFPYSPAIKLELAYLLPPVLSSKDEIDAIRTGFFNNLEKLVQEEFRFNAPDGNVMYLPFYHAYYGCDNKEFLEKMVNCFYKTCPALSYTAPHVSKPRVAKQKIRLGFVFSFLLKDVLNQFMQSLIEAVSASDDFEVCLLITDTAQDDPALQKMTAKIKRFIALPLKLSDAQKIIAREKFDMLIWLEIGMAMRPYFLAMAKLAPIQCNMTGHPMTSAMPTIDYYFSVATLEPPDAQKHYTEKLILFERNLAVFHRPDLPKDVLSREELGLPQEAHLYCCPVMLFKLHPDMDTVFARILERDPRALIVLFDSQYKTLWRSTLEKRFTKCIAPHLRSRILFLPHAPKDRFFQILRNVDAILDTFHFSFGTTSFLTIAANLPFVTWPGEFMRGRGPYCLFQQMGVTELIAQTHEEYIELALRLANDKAFRAEMSEKIRKSSHVMFDDYEMTEHFARRLKEIYANHT